MNRILPLIICALVILPAAAVELALPAMEADEDPLAFYRRTHALIEGDQLQQISIDLDQDGVAEMLVSASESAKDGHGHFWQVFIQHEGRWRLAQVHNVGRGDGHGQVLFEARLSALVSLVDLGGWSLIGYGKGRPPFLTVIRKTAADTVTVSLMSSAEDHSIAIITYGLLWEHHYGDAPALPVVVETP